MGPERKVGSREQRTLEVQLPRIEGWVRRGTAGISQHGELLATVFGLCVFET